MSAPRPHSHTRPTPRTLPARFHTSTPTQAHAELTVHSPPTPKPQTQAHTERMGRAHLDAHTRRRGLCPASTKSSSRASFSIHTLPPQNGCVTLGQSFNLSELLCPQLQHVNNSSRDDLNEIIEVNAQVNYAAALSRDKWQEDGGGCDYVRT